MDATAVLFPPNQLLRRKTDGDEHQLQIEPLGLEPEEQVDAENHGERRESERVPVPSRPGEQHVERVGKDQLRGNEIRRSVHLSPVVPPIEKDGALGAGLQIVLRAEDHIDSQGTRPAPDVHGQPRVPQKEQHGGPPESLPHPHFRRAGPDGHHRKGDGEDERQDENAHRALSHVPSRFRLGARRGGDVEMTRPSNADKVWPRIEAREAI